MCRGTAAELLNKRGEMVPFAVTINAAGDVGTIHAGDDKTGLAPAEQIDSIHAKLQQMDFSKHEAVALVSHMALSPAQQFVAVQVEDADKAFAIAYPCRKRMLRGWQVEDEGDQVPEPIAPLVWAKAFDGGTAAG